MSDGRFHIERGDAATADATIVTAPATINAIIWDGYGLDNAIAEAKDGPR